MSSIFIRATLLGATLGFAAPGFVTPAAHAQNAGDSRGAATPLPPLNVERAVKPKKKKAPRRAPQRYDNRDVVQAAPASEERGGDVQGGESSARAGVSLTVPTTAQATALIHNIPGAAVVLPATDYRNAPSTNLKDVFDYTPGVMVGPRLGEDGRLSIRGSGLSRNYHLRSLQLYQDGFMPLNTADGYGDLLEIDAPSYRYIEVYKGANALRYGANSLGGAVNFVTPTGRDANLFEGWMDVGSFGYHRLHASAGAASGAVDAFVSGSWAEEDGFREHSNGESFRGSANVGIQISPNVETRFYVTGSDVRQRIPGQVDKKTALQNPEAAYPGNVTGDWQRNIDAIHYGNKTTIRVSPETTLELGAFGAERHLVHPIYLYFDDQFSEYGGFGRITDERMLDGFKNKLIAGVNVHNGEVDRNRFLNFGGFKGPQVMKWRDESENVSVYAEDSFYFLRNVALVGGTQFLHANRDRTDLLYGAQTGSNDYDLWSPKIGLLWNITAHAQGFANISRSAEVPSFDENDYLTPANSNIKAQRATTYEIGTRGRTPSLTWDLALYRANIDHELQCIYGSPGFCVVTNADQTVHQGVEAAVGFNLLKSPLAHYSGRDQLWLNMAYTFNDFFFDGDRQFGDNQLPGAPRHFIKTELLYKHSSGVYFGPNVELVPEGYYIDNANATSTDAYALWGLKLGYDSGKRFSAFIEGRNLSDKRYISSANITNFTSVDAPMFEPGVGRSVYAGIRMKW
jgi:iron complex outermembrane recepter protein